MLHKCQDESTWRSYSCEGLMEFDFDVAGLLGAPGGGLPGAQYMRPWPQLTSCKVAGSWVSLMKAVSEMTAVERWHARLRSGVRGAVALARPALRSGDGKAISNCPGLEETRNVLRSDGGFPK